MAVVSVTESWSRVGSTSSSSDGETYRASFTRGMQVEHGATTTQSQILSHPDIPQIRDFYPDTYVPCVSRKVQTLGPVFSIVTVEYSGEVGPGGEADSPFNKLPEYVWSDTTSSEPVQADWDGNAIVTTAGEPINGVTVELADQTLTVTRNYLGFSPWLTHQYRHSVNSDAFAGYPPGTARLVGFSATQKRADNNSWQYWQVNAKIQFRYPFGDTPPEKAWYARVLNEGYHCLRGTGANYKKCLDADEKVAGRPMLLNEDGTQAALAKDGYTPDPTKANWLFFKLYDELPYAALGLL